MRAETELLLRNRARIDGVGPTLIVDPPDIASINVLKREDAHFWIRHYGVARDARKTAFTYWGALWAGPRRNYRRAVVYLPKGRRLQQMTFAQLGPCLGDDAVVYVVGANQSGIKSVKSSLRAPFDPPRTIDSARKCTLVQTSLTVPASDFDVAPWRQRWSAQVGSRSITVESLPGTFSDGGLDAGTALLLEALEASTPTARILDMACGCGPLGAMMAKYQPNSRIHLADVHAAAVASAEATIALNALDNATCGPSDWFSDIENKFDTIVCNPPFHDGVTTDMTMAGSVIRDAPAYLRPNGTLWLVANRFLPYRNALERAFSNVTIVRDTKRFRVYRAERA